MKHPSLHNPEGLKNIIDNLDSVENPDESVLSALAESYFRLALHPSTEHYEALAYLKKGFKIDNIDPRFSYHLARIYFLLKEFDKAQKWIKMAHNLCPTSHRIWLHIGLLQDELNHEYNKQNQYTKDELKEISAKIHTAIINKEDSIDSSLVVFEPTYADSESAQANRIEANLDNLTEDSLEKFIGEMLKKHVSIHDKSYEGKNPRKVLEEIDEVSKELKTYAIQINEHIQSYLISIYGKSDKNLSENELKKIGIVYNSYNDTVLKINEQRGEIRDKALYLLHPDQLALVDLDEKGRDLYKKLTGELDSVDIKLGNKIVEIEWGKGSSLSRFRLIRIENDTQNSTDLHPSSFKAEKITERSLEEFIGDMLKNHISIHKSAFKDEEPQKLLLEIEQVAEELNTSANKINEHIQSYLASFCEISKKDLGENHLLQVSRVFYSYNDTVLRINIQRRKIRDKALYLLNAEQLAIDERDDNILGLQRKVMKDIGSLDHKLGKTKIVEIERGIDASIKSLRSKRTINRDQCRWLGVYDISIENSLRKEATTISRNRIIHLLEDVFNMIAERENGYASVAVLSTEWLISGYSSQSIRRLIEGLKDRKENGYVAFIDVMCDLFECDIQDFPELLVSNLKAKKLTALLAAIILKKRYVWRDIVFEKNYEFKKAIKLVSRLKRSGTTNEEEAEINELIMSLISGLKTMWNPRKIPITIDEDKHDEENTKAYTIEEVESIFESVSAGNQKLEKLAEKLQIEFLRDFKPRYTNIESAEDYAYVSKQYAALTQLEDNYADYVEKAGKLKEQAFNGLQDDIQNEIKVKISKKKDRITSDLKGLKCSPRIIKSIKNNLTKSASKNKNLETVSKEEIISLIFNETNEIKEFVLSGSGSGNEIDSTKPDFNTYYDPIGLKKSKQISDYGLNKSGLEDLEEVLSFIDLEIEELIKYSMEGFEDFKAAQLNEPEILDLQILILNQAAETYYKLGLYQKAKKYWKHIVVLKEVSPDASLNIAISETMINQSDGSVLRAWRLYCEDLYRYDILIENPQKHAASRRNIHQKLSSVYAPVLISVKNKSTDEEEQKIDIQKFNSLINNPAKLYEFVIHKLAELINERITIKTPVAFLGLSLNATEEDIVVAVHALTEFFELVINTLPTSIQDGFRNICIEHIERCKNFCLNKDNLTLARNSNYEEDKEKLQEWIKSVLELKHKFYIFIQNSDNLENEYDYFDSIFIIHLLNRIPIEINESLLADVAGEAFSMYRSNNHAELPAIFANNIINVPIQSLMSKQFTDDDKVGTRLYNQLERIIVGKTSYQVDSSAEFIDLIDNPLNCLPDFVQEYLRSKEKDKSSKQHQQVVEYLNEKAKKYPAYTGLSRLLTNLDLKEGLPLLEIATDKAINPRIKLECLRLIDSTKLNSEIIRLNELMEAASYMEAYSLFTRIIDSYKDKITISEDAINEIEILTKEDKDELLLLTGRYYKDASQIEADLSILNFEDKEIIERVVKCATDANMFELRNYLPNIITGWIKAQSNDIIGHIEEIHKYLKFLLDIHDAKSEEGQEWYSNMNHLLAKASIAYLGEIDTKENTEEAIDNMKMLISLDKDNDIALYYYAQFNQTLGGIIMKESGSGISHAKKYYKDAYETVLILKDKDLDEDIRSAVTKLFDFLEDNKDAFIN